MLLPLIKFPTIVPPARKPGLLFLRALFTLCFLSLAPLAHAEFSFVHLTDTHYGSGEGDGSAAAKNAVLLKEIATLPQKTAFVVHTGDVCESATDAEYAQFRKTSALLGSIRQYVAPGNHDVRWNPRGKEGYTRGTGQPLYQSWDYEQVHFILLDSTVLLQHWGHFDQAMREWLVADLKKVGPRRPVVIGFHHFIGRPGPSQVDNETEFARLIRPYNVRLLLIGHGHSDITWNVNGIPAIMAKGLYQGSYNLVRVTKDKLTVYRRTADSQSPSIEVLSEPLSPPGNPARNLEVNVLSGQGEVKLSGDFPAESEVTFRFNNGEESPLRLSTEGGKGKPSVWQGSFLMTAAYAGDHQITATATLPDKRVYATSVSLTLGGAGYARPQWKAQVGGEVQGKIVRAGDLALVPTMRGDLVALDAATGKERYRVRTGGAVLSTPCVSNGSVYFGSADHGVYAADLKTGRVLWHTDTGGAVFGGAARAGDVVCIASTDAKIYGLSAADGKVRWTAQAEGMYQSQAATDGERFFVGGWDNYFRCLDAKTGAEVWKQKFGKNAQGDYSFYYAPAIGSPAVGDGRAFVTSNDGVLHAMNALDGSILWEVNGPALGYSSPLLVGDRIYNGSLTDKGRVFCFNAADGARVWQASTGAVIYDSSCSYGGGNVFIGSVDSTLSAIRVQDGQVQWQYRLAPGHVLSTPAADDARVIVGSLSGEVVSLPVTPAPPVPVAAAVPIK